tara:strand:- start:1379 stop:1648 length:270 start_codon:yes stop_codon:yes gene_type:complete
MEAIIENIKAYFSKKDKGEETRLAPEGMCPPCWGHSEWDGQYYKVIKDKHLKPENEIYNSFISKIVDKHIKSTYKHENKYICTTCDKEI